MKNIVECHYRHILNKKYFNCTFSFTIMFQWYFIKNASLQSCVYLIFYFHQSYKIIVWIILLKNYNLVIIHTILIIIDVICSFIWKEIEQQLPRCTWKFSICKENPFVWSYFLLYCAFSLVFVLPFWHLLVDLKYLRKGQVIVESIINEMRSGIQKCVTELA